MDIVEFLTACIRDDEVRAREATTADRIQVGPLDPATGQPTEVGMLTPEWRMQRSSIPALDASEAFVSTGGNGNISVRGGDRAPQLAAHIAAQDPARTLRRVAAYRAILAAYERVEREEDMLELTSSAYWAGLEFAVKTLAAEFEDRPGFNPQWSLT